MVVNKVNYTLVYSYGYWVVKKEIDNGFDEYFDWESSSLLTILYVKVEGKVERKVERRRELEKWKSKFKGRIERINDKGCFDGLK